MGRILWDSHSAARVLNPTGGLGLLWQSRGSVMPWPSPMPVVHRPPKRADADSTSETSFPGESKLPSTTSAQPRLPQTAFFQREMYRLKVAEDTG